MLYFSMLRRVVAIMKDSQVGIPPWLMVFLFLKYVPGLCKLHWPMCPGLRTLCIESSHCLDLRHCVTCGKLHSLVRWSDENICKVSFQL